MEKRWRNLDKRKIIEEKGKKLKNKIKELEEEKLKILWVRKGRMEMNFW